MAQRKIDIRELRLLGGRLCIDFVNTIENRAGDRPEELLSSYADLVGWSRHAGVLDEPDGFRLLALAGENSGAAEQVLEQALYLREALHRVLLAIATQHEPLPADLQVLETAYGHAIANARLAPAEDHFAWSWRDMGAQLDRMLWPVALSAVELLTDGDLRRVKVCANPHGCGWLFYDGSKNLSRRWCRMDGCGSQVKMRRQYAKRRAKPDRPHEEEIGAQPEPTP
jgi:predicted RNA-binding Zn ribbon-like protein